MLFKEYFILGDPLRALLITICIKRSEFKFSTTNYDSVSCCQYVFLLKKKQVSLLLHNKQFSVHIKGSKKPLQYESRYKLDLLISFAHIAFLQSLFCPEWIPLLRAGLISFSRNIRDVERIWVLRSKSNQFEKLFLNNGTV